MGKPELYYTSTNPGNPTWFLLPRLADFRARTALYFDGTTWYEAEWHGWTANRTLRFDSARVVIPQLDLELNVVREAETVTITDGDRENTYTLGSEVPEVDDSRLVPLPPKFTVIAVIQRQQNGPLMVFGFDERAPKWRPLFFDECGVQHHVIEYDNINPDPSARHFRLITENPDGSINEVYVQLDSASDDSNVHTFNGVQTHDVWLALPPEYSLLLTPKEDGTYHLTVVRQVGK